VFDVPQDFLQPEPCNVSAELPEGFESRVFIEN